MDATQAHLMVNHLPIVGAFLGFALVSLAALRRGERHTVQAAALVLGLSAAGGVVAYVSGEEAEHAAEERPGFDHDAVEEHEDGAKLALVSLILAAGIGGGLVYLTRRGGRAPQAGTLVWAGVTLLSVATMTRMGLTGRVVGHPDTYGENASAGPANPSEAPAAQH